MKTPPNNPEFAKFTEAMRQIVTLSKKEMQRRIEAGKQSALTKRPPAVGRAK